MTTEVAVMNRHAVALATDSAGTVSISEEESNTQKIYFSEDKLFALSKYHPVGIMFYGNADFMTVPLEVIVKEYRKALGGKEYSTLKQYGRDFIRYLGEQQRYLSEDVKERIYKYSVYDFLSSINDMMKDAREKGKEFALNELFKSIVGLDDLPNLPKGMTQRLLDKYGELTKRVIKDAISEKLSPSNVKKLVEICALMITKKTSFPGNYAGIVIAGYGKSEFYPAIESYKLYGMFGDFLRFYREDEKSDRIDHGNSASVMAFAQGDMVSTFMEGIDPNFRLTLLSNIQDILEATTVNLRERLVGMTDRQRQRVEKELSKTSKKLLEIFVNEMQVYQTKYHVDPIVTNVRFLAKDALAEMAETLVNMTSFKRKSSMVPETVGGPVDVAVISKGDGFIWIKRKHYFDPKYNHQFFENYYDR